MLTSSGRPASHLAFTALSAASVPSLRSRPTVPKEIAPVTDPTVVTRMGLPGHGTVVVVAAEDAAPDAVFLSLEHATATKAGNNSNKIAARRRRRGNEAGIVWVPPCFVGSSPAL